MIVQSSDIVSCSFYGNSLDLYSTVTNVLPVTLLYSIKSAFECYSNTFFVIFKWNYILESKEPVDKILS